MAEIGGPRGARGAIRPGLGEPLEARRLRYWEWVTWLLLIPGAVLMPISELLALIPLIALGVFRYLIRRARQEYGAKLERMGLIPGIVYGGLLVIAIGGAVLRAMGK